MQGVPNCEAWDHGRLGQVKCGISSNFYSLVEM